MLIPTMRGALIATTVVSLLAVSHPPAIAAQSTRTTAVDTARTTFFASSAELEAHMRARAEEREARRIAAGGVALTPPIPGVAATNSVTTPCARQPDPDAIGNGGSLSSSRIIISRPRSGTAYMVYVRGAPGWGQGHAMRAGGGSGPFTQTTFIQRGPINFTAGYDEASNVLDVHGVKVPLDSGNVIIVDRVDGVGGPPLVRQVGCVPAGDRTLMGWRALLTIPAVLVFTFDLDR